MACLMKRTPCCLAISPSSCGSMMTKRDLSYSKCRSIKGSVPLPIEPKPIMTMGPEIFAWMGADGLMNSLRKTGWLRRLRGSGDQGIRGSGGTSLGGHFDLDLHLGLVEARDHQQRGGRADVAEKFAADREMGVRVAGVGDVVGRADDIGHRKTAFFQGGLDG